MSYPRPPLWLTDALPSRLYDPGQKIVLPDLAEHSAAGARLWLKQICNVLDISPSALALEAGLSASTLNRPLRKDGPSNLSATTIEKIVETSRRLATEKMQSIARSIQNESKYKALKSIEEYKTRNVLIRGELSGKWFYPERFLKQEESSMSIPFYPYDEILHGFYVFDDIFAPAYEQHSVVVGSMLADEPDDFILRKDQVIAFRRHDTGGIQCSIWTIKIDPAMDFWLLPLNPALSIPAVYIGKELHSSLDSIYVSHQVVGVWVGSTRKINEQKSS